VLSLKINKLLYQSVGEHIKNVIFFNINNEKASFLSLYLMNIIDHE